MLTLLGLLVKPAYAQASPCGAGAGNIDLGDCLQLSNGQSIASVYTDPAFLVNLIVRNVFVFAGILLFFLIILAGYKFVLGGKKGAEDAKKIATNAIVGFVIMFTAYWVVQLIKIITGVEILL